MVNSHKTDEGGVLVQIKEQVKRLVVPDLHELCGLMMERRAAVRTRDDALKLKQQRIEEEGMAAAFRLMMPEGGEQPSTPMPYPYGRVLPDLKQENDDE